jgi:nucleoside-diphosphate-sugar epimerase
MQEAGKVVITSANCATAGLLIPRLRQKGYYTTGLIRRPAAVGADAVITDWMHSEAAKKAMAEADHIIHLSGDANAGNNHQYKDSNYNTTKLVADCVRGGGCRRVIYLSYAHAATSQENLYLHYKGHAEHLLQQTGKEAVIFRCPVIVDAPGQPSRMDELFLSKKGRPVPVIGNGRQKMRPVYRGDVVSAILSALVSGRSGVYELSGPEEMTIDDFIRLANQDPSVRIRHIPAWLAKILGHAVPALSPTFVDLMLYHTQSVYNPETYEEFGLVPSPISALFSSP